METLVKLTANEITALHNLKREGGGVLTTSIPDKNDKDVFGEVEPGMPVYKKLERKGLVLFTEENPVDDPGGPMDGFVFTNEVYLTEAGEEYLRESA